MNRLTALSLSMLLLLASFPLISIGTTWGPDWLWWLGLAALCAGGVIPPSRRLLTRIQPEPQPTRAGMTDDERVS
jgi:hypothetical protein